ncbi:hypothetical protein [Pantoea anthophila]|uniref:hypothetical protein n=1 Tax=Pantoea anthophila TaxID=470931 RepID=UPI00277F138F|nr:hypothetical protein [Pantoea anthophila]MDQ1211448.1 hypothetical protein [Pantoea anthophila]
MIDFDPQIGIRDYVNDQLSRFGLNYDDSLDANQNLMNVFSLYRRNPIEKKRSVFELPGIETTEETKNAYESLKTKLSEGLPIKPHLSLSTNNLNYKDLLLNSWNIHHLHLSEEPYKDGFFKRTGPVLFCMFFDDVVILIDIMLHGKGHSDVWVNETLIKKLHKYLPESISQYKIKGILAQKFNAQQLMALRKKHYNNAIRMEDGTVYQLMGIMSDGSNFHDTTLLIKINRRIDYLKKSQNVIQTQ